MTSAAICEIRRVVAHAIAEGWATPGPPPMTLAQQRDFLRHLGKHDDDYELPPLRDRMIDPRSFVNERFDGVVPGILAAECPRCLKRPPYCRCGPDVARWTPPA